MTSKKVEKLIFNPQSSIMSISTNPMRKRKFMRRSPLRPKNVYVNEHSYSNEPNYNQMPSTANRSNMRDMIKLILRTNEAS